MNMNLYLYHEDPKSLLWYEEAMSTVPQVAYQQARGVFCGRFRRGEMAIARSARYSFMYAKNVLKDRFVLGEKMIATDAYYACLYAMDILQRPFPMAEAVILQDNLTRNWYMSAFRDVWVM